MADIKRSVSAIDSSFDESKKHSKPGRKPVDTEPKSKRTAQNRAAQRAYRERKEQKLYDLEQKVKLLQDENLKVLSDKEFLASQVDILKNELKKFTSSPALPDYKSPELSEFKSPEFNIKNTLSAKFAKNNKNLFDSGLNNGLSGGDLAGDKIFDTLGGLNGDFNSSRGDYGNFGLTGSEFGKNSIDKGLNGDFGKNPHGLTREFSNSGSEVSRNSDFSKHSLNHDLRSNSEHSSSDSRKSPFDLPSPYDLKNSLSIFAKNDKISPNSDFKVSPNNYSNPIAISDKNSDSSNFRNSITSELKYSNLTSPEEQKLFDKSFDKNSNITSPDLDKNLFDQDIFSDKLDNGNSGFGFGKFEEQANPFCAKLSEACGTKDDIIPKSLNDTTNNNIQDFEDPLFFNNSNDPLSFLNDSNFDVNLAFSNRSPEFQNFDNNDFDPVNFLTTEESIYDQISNKSEVNTQRTPKEVDTNFNFNEFVKSSLDNGKDDAKEMVPKSGNVMRCSEIWDRISSHPKYSEIDIDGLCNELKSKAKCSEKGVVINSTDVNFLIEQSALLEKEK